MNKRVTIITGHYGSGKTNFSINYAIRLSESGKKVCLVDLDIVNPYFRAFDLAVPLENRGIRVVAPVYAGTNLDIPALQPEIYGVLEDRTYTVVLDVGGDDAGAAALGRFSGLIKGEKNYRHYYVVNARRALTQSPEQALEILNEITAAGHIGADALINNTNLGNETSAEVVLASVGYADEVSRVSGLPVEYTAVREDLAETVSGKVPHVFPVRIYVKTPWET